MRIVFILLVAGMTANLVFELYRLAQPKRERYITISRRHENGVAMIESKKYLVPFTIEETAIPIKTDGIINYLFLGQTQNFKGSLISVFFEIILGLATGFLLLLPYVEKIKLKYGSSLYTIAKSIWLLFILSKIFTVYINKWWFKDFTKGQIEYVYSAYINHFYQLSGIAFLSLIIFIIDFKDQSRRSNLT